jgi:hypothetical protein
MMLEEERRKREEFEKLQQEKEKQLRGKISKFQNFKISKFQNFKISKFQNFKIFDYRGSEASRRDGEGTAEAGQATGPGPREVQEGQSRARSAGS